MRFSIVAPNMNEMPYIREMFLVSLCEQTFNDFEVIVVDGGSTDGSLDALHIFNKFHYLPIKTVIDKTRNIGYVRNLGAKHSKGDILLHTSTDIRFPKDFLHRVNQEFIKDPSLIAMGGRCKPVGKGAGFVCNLAYYGFDFLRWFFSQDFMPLKWRKIRPAGNFMAIYRDFFFHLGGYPEVKINEDGKMGYRIDDYLKNNGWSRARFKWSHYVEHNVKRFEKKGGIGGVLFYLYVIGELFPVLEPLFRNLEKRSAEEFADR